MADRLGLEVVEVGVRATERLGSKVRVLADALRMLGEVWAVRQATAHGAYGDVRQDLTRIPDSVMPPALQSG